MSETPDRPSPPADLAASTSPIAPGGRGRRRYHRPGEAVWRRVRADYLGGATMAECAGRHGVSVEAIKHRIWKEGWSKRAYATAGAAAGAAAGEGGEASAPPSRAEAADFHPRRDARPPPAAWLPEDYEPSGPGERSGPRAGSKGSRARGDEAGPTWFRLTDEAWALIREEYLDGATAKQLAKRWRVGASSIYRRAYTEGWTKDSRARLMVEEVEALDAAEAQAEAARRARAAEADANARAAAPASPAALAEAAFADASRAFAAGRSEAAQRLLKLAGEARRMADAEVARLAAEGAGRAAEALAEAEPPPLETDEVVISVDRLISLTEHWAALMIRGELGDLPAFLIHAAAHWRRTNLIGPILYSHDFEALEKVCAYWHDEVFDPEGRVRALPSMEDVARCYVWGHRDFPALAQVPPRMRELQAATVEVVRRAKPDAVGADA